MEKVVINGIEVEVAKGATILEASKKAKEVYIPTLCHLHLDSFNLEHRVGSCRICVVEVEQNGAKRMLPSCCTPVADGMVVRTNTPEVVMSRKIVLELLLSNHPFECLTCAKNLNCELQALARELGITHIDYTGEKMEYPIDVSSKSLKRNPNKCIMCRRCETACNDMQTVGVLTGYRRGFSAIVSTAEMKPLVDTNCTFCGQCVNVCPTAALTEISYAKEVWKAINNPNKTVVVQIAPSVRVAIGEEFGMEPGSIATGKLVTGLRALGFDSVFDTNFAADLTIMEEAKEIVERVKSGKNLPILTSCCPSWVGFIEHQFPELLHIPSSAKSPQQMFGAIAKTYYAQKIGVKPEDLIVVSLMPCLAKKFEASRPEFARDGVPDVDYVITTREAADMFREMGINLANLHEEDFDNPLGESTGAGTIFGVTGGVIEAALRTAYEWMTGKTLEKVDFTAVRGLNGVKEATIDVDGMALNIAVASGLGNARTVLEKIQSGEANYHAIEIMACPGGCIDGGGQPYIHGDTSKLEKRMKALYSIDEKKTIRKSHENPHIIQLYKEFLGEPGSHKAHELLHTEYYRQY